MRRAPAVKHTSDPRDSALSRLGLALARFFLAATAGLVGTWFVLIECPDLAMRHEGAGTVWLWLLWLIPLAWGLLGVFFFDKMLTLARKWFEELFG